MNLDVKDRGKGANHRHHKMDGESQVTRLKFSHEQLGKLNYLLSKKIDKNIHYETGYEQSTTIAERLLQRLLSSIGHLDSRFSTKFLVSLQRSRHNEGFSKSRMLEYLIRLDELSTPVLYKSDRRPRCEIMECEMDSETPGFARIFLRDTAAKNWGDFINNSGYLRRDKVQERFVELLAMAAANSYPGSPTDVDDSFLCGAPGKIVDAFTLHEILKIPPEEQVFYGAAVNVERFPEPRDFRLAIVDEPGGVRLRIGFLSPTLAGNDVEVHLQLAIGVEQWPRTCNFPNRVPLEHPECLLFYQMAETGMFLVACGPYPANWQIRLPAAEALLLNHHGPNSTTAIVMETIQYILQEIQGHTKDFTNKYIWQQLTPHFLQSILWNYMEEDDSNPIQLIQNWSLKTISKHVIHLLETIITSLRHQFQPCYFFPTLNLFVNPGHVLQEDYQQISIQIHSYISKLFEASLRPIEDKEDFEKMGSYEEVDGALIEKWKDVVSGLLPPAATRSRRFSFAVSKSKNEVAQIQYTNKQLEYVGLLLKHMLIVKKLTMQASDFTTEEDLFPIREDPIEDVIFLLVTIMEQVWKSKTNSKNPKHTLKSKSRTNFDLSTAKLVESVRKNKELSKMDFVEDTILVQTVLRWLYKGLDQSKHSLAPILRPYLQKLFINSHEISWHLESIKMEEITDEIKALGIFCRLVNSKEISPANGLIESINKGWIWAKNILSFVENQSSITLIFSPKRGKVFRHILALPTHEKGKESKGTLLRKLKENGNNTLSKKFNSLWRKGNIKLTNKNTLYCELRDTSPLSSLIEQKYRFGNHRCFGDLIHSLITLNKISYLQEISNLLPSPDRQNVLYSIQKLSKENKRFLTLRKRSLPIQSICNTSERTLLSPQLYTAKEESAGISERPVKERKERVKQTMIKNVERDNKDTLIGNCRSVRIMDDCKVVFTDNLKIRALCQFSTPD